MACLDRSRRLLIELGQERGGLRNARRGATLPGTTEERDVGRAVADKLRHEALELLDFPAIRGRLAELTAFFGARALAVELRPSYDEREVQALLKETTEGLVLLGEIGSLELGADTDPSPSIRRAALEGLLTGHELMAVGDVLVVLRRARSWPDRLRGSAPLLSLIAEGIPELRPLERQISGSIGPRGEVLDQATPSLGPIRKQISQAYQRVESALERVVQSGPGRDALQDDVISMRGDRLVVQVKSEHRSRVPGIVHDASNTGATLFVEPFSTVELCNSWRELVLQEQREVERVLRELSGMVGDLAEELLHGIELTSRLDLILARARLSAAIDGITPMSPNAMSDASEAPVRLRLVQARHPVLEQQAIPIDIAVGPDWSVLVITGPNTGGKTVAMKTVGLLALMHQSGLLVPAAEGSSLPVFGGIFADIGDHQSIERAASRFGAHMENIIDILSSAGSDSLLLLDELGTSTDAEEGSALAKAILEHLAAEGVTTITTTHHRNVAAHAEVAPGMMNASVELDADTLRPTYHLTQGIPGRSYAMSVATQLGLSEEIIDKARSLIEPQHLQFEDWLNELQREREALQQRLREAEAARFEAEEARDEHQSQLAELARRREDIVRTMRRELAEHYDAVRRRLSRVEASLTWEAPAAASQRVPVDLAREELKEAERETRELQEREPAAAGPIADAEVPAPENRAIGVGDIVELVGLSVQGRVVAMHEASAEAEVAVGSARLRLALNRLALTGDAGEPSVTTEVAYDLGPALPTPEIDLRGERAEEALVLVEDFLDRAVRDGLGSVRIIHGKGTGALRNAVRDLLERHPLARSFDAEPPDRGGDGATHVELT